MQIRRGYPLLKEKTWQFRINETSMAQEEIQDQDYILALTFDKNRRVIKVEIYGIPDENRAISNLKQ